MELNIAKIKDGIFIGDKFAGTTLSILVQFKISHIINTCGNQILYNLENTGIKYLTYNWPENPSNNMVIIKDEISKKILHFIDNSLLKGSGIMIFSLKGQNRACVAVIIYLMKKYNWSLKKCREYLASKKKDVRITKNFLNQLIHFEERLTKKYNNILTNDWSNIKIKDSDELLMNNTYLNEKENTKKNYLLKKNKENSQNDKIDENKEKRHIEWADYKNPENFGKNWLIIKTDINQDLFFKKKVKSITNHIKMKPAKSCIKYNGVSNELYNYKNIYFIEEKKEEKDKLRSSNKQILKNTFLVNDNHKKLRKLTYDNKDNNNYNLKKNYIDNHINRIIIDSEKKIDLQNDNNDIINNNNNIKINNIENEKNNNIKIMNNSMDKDDIKNNNINNILPISDDKSQIQHNFINLNKNYNNNNLIMSQKEINNFMNVNKYALYLENSDKIKNEKRTSAKKLKRKNNSKLVENKKYYLGQSNSTKFKENEKDIIIPKINKNNTQQTLNYEYNLNFHTNKMFIRSLMNNQEIKNNINNARINNSYNKKNQRNSIEIKNNKLFISNDYNINNNKNALIFNQFNSYNFKPSGPIKINNNLLYKISNSADKNNNNFIDANNVIFNNINKKESLSKGINNSYTSSKKIYNHNNRPLSAQRSNNNFNFNNSNGFSSKNMNMIELGGPKKRMPSPMTSQFSLMKNINNSNKNFNNRYNISNQTNKVGIGKKSYQKK